MRIISRFAAASAVGLLSLALGVGTASAATTHHHAKSDKTASTKAERQHDGKRGEHAKHGKKHHGAKTAKPGTKADKSTGDKSNGKSTKGDKANGKPGKPGKPNGQSSKCTAEATNKVHDVARDVVTATIVVTGCNGVQVLSNISHWYDLPTWLKDSCKSAPGDCGRYKPGVWDQNVTNGSYPVTVPVPPHDCDYQVDWELNGTRFASAHGGSHNCHGTTTTTTGGGGSGGGSSSNSDTTSVEASTPGGLAMTGSEVAPLLIIAALLLAGGFVFSVAGRKPKTKATVAI